MRKKPNQAVQKVIQSIAMTESVRFKKDRHHEIMSDVNVKWMMDRDLQRTRMSDIRRHILLAWGGDQWTTMAQVSMQ